ncbi:MAG TPA: Wzz/FepE/Etk N-terminal domain-containing protein [Phnomibacter sp.]|nr:Wzz/FepE/Etk N-terminal domain-containing protein [Phnomibacter sp.]
MNTNPDIQPMDIPAYRVPAFRDLLYQLRDWFFFMLRKWWLIGGVVVIAGLLGVTYAWMTKPKYESRLTFALEESGGGLSGALSLAAEFGLNLGGSRSIFAGDNILQIISSRRVIENVLLSVDSSEVDGKKRTLAQYLLDLKRGDKVSKAEEKLLTVNYPVGKPREQFSYIEDSILFVLYKYSILDNLVAHRPDKKLGIYEVRLTAPEERFAKVFTERLMKETTDFYTELRSKKSRQTLQILEERVASLRGNVSSAISSRSSTQDANMNPAFAAAQVPLQQRQYDITAYSSAYSELFKNLELARYQFLQDVPLLQVIDDVHYPLKKIKKGRMFMGLLFAMIAGVLVVVILSVVYGLKTSEKSIR